MKKLSMKFLMMTGLMVAIFFACNNDDDGADILPPRVEAPGSATVEAEGTTEITFDIVTPGGYQSSSVASSDGNIATATIDDEPGGDSNNGELTMTITGVAEGTATLTVTVTDNENQSATDDISVTVSAATGGGGGTEDGIATVGDTLGDIENLSLLAAAIEATGLTTTLNDAEEVTIFAPRNAAIDSLIKSQIGDDFDDEDEDGTDNLNALVAALTREGVSGILQAHVVADSLPSGDLEVKEYPTLNEGSTITITTEGDNVFVNGAQVVTADIIVGNGVIHIIDSVININANPAVEEEEGTVRVASSDEGVGTTTWTANNTYILDGFVYVNEGQTLTIEPGTVIKGRPGQAARASALIVAQGGVIEANGTAESPIIFTAEADDLNGSVAEDATGLWGGVIILGNAPTNNNDVGGVKNIEGIPTEEVRGSYGGDAADDDSGNLNYISIRHGGSVIGANNEINGLTLGAVGTGTEISNVEVWSNLDDGIEFFGGTVNASNLVVAYCGDDGLDADEGYSGNVQKAVVWQTSATLRSSDPRALELDGGVGANENAQPYSDPIFANLTLVYDEGDNDLANAFVLRDNSSASIYNSIIVGHDAPVAIERRTDLNSEEDGNEIGGSSFDRYEDGTLVLAGNVFYEVNDVTGEEDFANVVNIDTEGDEDSEGNLDDAILDRNQVLNPTLGTGTSRFTPTAGVTEGLAELPDEDGLTTVTYRGAIDPAAGANPYFANWSRTWAVIGQ